jgi:polysaccharide biosynthesis protein PslG
MARRLLERLRRACGPLLAVALAAELLLAPGGARQSRAQLALDPTDPRFFGQTGFRIDRDAFWDYFQARGGLGRFGYPVSNTFTFLGCATQFFQRLILQQCGGQGVGVLNLLDPDLFPYTRVNGSTFPAADPALKAATPQPSDPTYASAILDFVAANAPDVWNGQPVNFGSTFFGTVSPEVAGTDEPGLLGLLDLEVWGAPISPPAADPTNPDFVYQRFQRGIMHYDAGCGCTQSILLADYFKSVITGQGLPPDLQQQAQASPLYRSVLPGAAPAGTDYDTAFTPPTVPGPDYGASVFIWGHPDTTPRDLGLAQAAGLRWQKTLFEWRRIEGACRGCFDWREADRVVRASAAAGLRIVARLDYQPAWTGVPETSNGPPRDYQDFFDFVHALVDRYRLGSPIGQVQAIEVWNEPNLSRQWADRPVGQQTAADYVRLLAGAYTAAKAADPNVVVVSAGLSPTGVTSASSVDDLLFLQWLYAAGLKGGVNYDVLGANANTQAPCVTCDLDSLPAFPHPSFYFRRVEQLRQAQVASGDGDRQVWLMEFGWTSDQVHPAYSWFAVSEQQKADNLVAAYQYAHQSWQPWIGLMALWTFSDPTWAPDREEYWWAITNPDGSLRPAYTALQTARRSGQLP